MGSRIVRAMFLQQPWAELVVEGVFPVLVRLSSTGIRGRVAVIARGWDPWASIDDKRPGEDADDEFPQEATVIGSVCICGCDGPIPVGDISRYLAKSFGKNFAKFYPKHYFSGDRPVYVWFLEKPAKLKRTRAIDVGRHWVWMRLD